jgi:hypothetical protein
MARLKPDAPPRDQIECDFIDAIKRLQEGCPNNRKLKNMSARGVVKITFANVALQAGRSRTLIALVNCRYPRVREMVKQAKGGKSCLPTTHTQLIDRLRAEIADLKVQKDRYQAEAVAHYLARIKLERDANRQRDITERLKRELAAAGKVLTLVPKSDSSEP